MGIRTTLYPQGRCFSKCNVEGCGTSWETKFEKLDSYSIYILHKLTTEQDENICENLHLFISLTPIDLIQFGILSRCISV